MKDGFEHIYQTTFFKQFVWNEANSWIKDKV